MLKINIITPSFEKMANISSNKSQALFYITLRQLISQMLAALGSIAKQQTNLTENIMKKVNHFLYYSITHPNAIVTY